MSIAAVMLPVGLLIPQEEGCSILTVSFGAAAQSTSSLISLNRSVLGPVKRSQLTNNRKISKISVIIPLYFIRKDVYNK
jgi:hypothetical protein